MVTIKFEFPKTCGKCLFYKTSSYRSHNESGEISTCSMGFMMGFDMRDKTFENKKFIGCKLEDETIVTK